MSTFAWRNRRSNRESERHFLSAEGAGVVCGRLGLQRSQLGWIPAKEEEAKKRMWHLSGANAFFCELIEATLSSPDHGLLEWRPEHQIRTKRSWIQPDGFGRLLHASGVSGFFFEFDRATENRGPLVAKLRRYLRAASDWSGGTQAFPSVLVLVPDARREAALAELLAEASSHAEPEAALVAPRFLFVQHRAPHAPRASGGRLEADPGCGRTGANQRASGRGAARSVGPSVPRLPRTLSRAAVAEESPARMKQAARTVEVSGPRRRIARGVLRNLPAPEGKALRPLARALVDLAIALRAGQDDEEACES